MDRTHLKTPLGILEICGTSAGIRSVSFTELSEAEIEDTPESLQECRKQLFDYFQGTLKEFSLQLDPQGTPFQKRVWTRLQDIDYGETSTYAEQTKTLGDPKAIRAVAGANGRNPIAIIIPCHRVIGSNGKLTGYAGGLWRKKWLLEHENPPAQKSLF